MVLKGAAEVTLCDHRGTPSTSGEGSRPAPGGMITHAVGKSHTPCPCCKAGAERVGWA